MRKNFKRHIQGKKVLLIFLLTNLVYCCMLFITLPKVMSYANGMTLFDMMPTGYDLEYVNQLLNSLGSEGRNAYQYVQLPADMIYPFLFGLSYSLMLAYFLNILGWIEKPIFLVVFLPVIAGLFDYLENLGILTMLNAYPHLSSTTVALTNSFTIIKSTLSTISFILLLIFIILFFVQRRRLVKTVTNH